MGIPAGPRTVTCWLCFLPFLVYFMTESERDSRHSGQLHMHTATPASPARQDQGYACVPAWMADPGAEPWLPARLPASQSRAAVPLQLGHGGQFLEVAGARRMLGEK